MDTLRSLNQRTAEIDDTAYPLGGLLTVYILVGLVALAAAWLDWWRRRRRSSGRGE